MVQYELLITCSQSNILNMYINFYYNTVIINPVLWQWLSGAQKWPVRHQVTVKMSNWNLKIRILTAKIVHSIPYAKKNTCVQINAHTFKYKYWTFKRSWLLGYCRVVLEKPCGTWVNLGNNGMHSQMLTQIHLHIKNGVSKGPDHLLLPAKQCGKNLVTHEVTHDGNW